MQRVKGRINDEHTAQRQPADRGLTQNTQHREKGWGAHTHTHTHTCPGVLNSNLYSGRSSSACLLPNSRFSSPSFLPCPSDTLSLFFLAGVDVEAWKDSTDFLFLLPSTMSGWSNKPRSAELCGGGAVGGAVGGEASNKVGTACTNLIFSSHKGHT